MFASKAGRIVLVLIVSGIVSGALSACQAATQAPAATTAPKATEKSAAAEQKSAPTAASSKAADSAAIPTSLPQATQQYLAELKKDASALAGLDAELKVPQEWIDGAKSEGKVSIISTLDPPQADKMFKPFGERYPFVQITYGRASLEERSIKTLVSAESGKATVDVVTGIGGSFFMYKEADALADLSVIPNWSNVPKGYKDEGGLWVGFETQYWGMAYNTNKVKTEDLPKTWEELLTNPIWRNGNIGVGNRPQLWLLQLWRDKGENWARDYMAKFFGDVKPQLRSEGMNAMVSLAAAGEFALSMPASDYRTFQMVSQGAPIRWWSPDPLPVVEDQLGIMKKAANPNAARLFTNWLLSKEGQMAQNLVESVTPVHKDMQNTSWMPFADIVQGRRIAVRLPEDDENIQPILLQAWEDTWTKSGGKR